VGDERCDVEALVRARAEPGAVDCGLATAGAGEDAVHACVVEAFRDGRAFYGLVQTPAVGSVLVRAWVGASGVSGGAGEVELVLADFDGCDDSTCRGAVQALPCPGATVGLVDGREQVTCGWDTPPCGVRLCGADPGCGG
jgi:hypothetical protein